MTDRRKFIKLSVVFLGGTALASACGTSNPSPTGGGSGGSGGGGTGGTGGAGGGGTGGGAAGGGTGGGAAGGGTGGGGAAGGGTGGGGATGGGSGGGVTGGGAGGGATGGGGGTASTCLTNGGHDSAITANHGHVLMVPAADFSASGDKTYSILGSADHDHMITLTAAQRTMIIAGTMVTTASTLGSSAAFPTHLHNVTVACA